eukprot:TRINITY_DN977_c0_g1_i1.p1 TRINITY_DN977_c0_g1~~TRINITY_DN977_c0_g1_i1.p1  ORF type:complete len:234 (-),score=61.79 TRINITY_DN977_c0_g1_i1:95-796(-)
MVDNIKGTFEVHIFLLPLNPDPETVAHFSKTCKEAAESTNPRIKALHLFLDFENVGYVGVLQTSRYCQGDIVRAREVVKEDCDLLEKAGFKVLRKKIECLASNDGVPVTPEENQTLLPRNYFEYHIKCLPKEGTALGELEISALKALSEKLSKELNIKVPLSYNGLNEGQRFLNTRTYGMGRDRSNQTVDYVKDLINQTPNIVVEKVIREFIVEDDNTQVDAGWLEPSDYKNQ